MRLMIMLELEAIITDVESCRSPRVSALVDVTPLSAMELPMLPFIAELG